MNTPRMSSIQPPLLRNPFTRRTCTMFKFHLLIPCLCLVIASAHAVEQEDVYIAGTDGYHTYRIPSLLVTKRGTLLAFCEGRKDSGADSGNIDLLLKRSIDGGKTWSKQEVIWDDHDNTCGNPCPVVDQRTGIIWLLMTHNPALATDTNSQGKLRAGERTAWVTSSKDDGKTWAEPRNITSDVKPPDWRWYATGPGVGIQVEHGKHKGRLVIPSDHSFGRQPQIGGSHVIYSDDRGATWKIGKPILPHVNECQVVELADKKGTLLMDMRSYFGRNRRTHSISSDGGINWTYPADAPELIEPICQASIFRYNWPTKKEKSRILFSNPASTKRENMTVRLSYDEGKTWPVSKLIEPGKAAYSCLAVLPNREIACLYERGEKNAYQKITLARFSLSWLENNK